MFERKHEIIKIKLVYVIFVPNILILIRLSDQMSDKIFESSKTLLTRVLGGWGAEGPPPICPTMLGFFFIGEHV